MGQFSHVCLLATFNLLCHLENPVNRIAREVEALLKNTYVSPLSLMPTINHENSLPLILVSSHNLAVQIVEYSLHAIQRK